MKTPRPKYDCREAFRRLDDYLDRELSSEEMERVRAHVEECTVCAPEFKHEETWIQGVRTKLARIEVSPEFRARLMRALKPDEQ